MLTLIKIGNSKGVRIPKTIIKQANLADTEIEFEVLPQGLLLKPVVDKPRQGWEEQIQKIQSQYASQKDNDCDDGLLTEVLNHDDDLDNWQW